MRKYNRSTTYMLSARVFSLALMVVSATANGQLFVDFTQVHNSVTGYTDLWNFSINNTGQPGIQAYIDLRVSDKAGSPVLQVRTHNIAVNAGMTLYSVENFRLLNQQYASNEAGTYLRNTGQFMVGNYTLCIAVKTPMDDYTLSEKCQGFNISQESQAQPGGGSGGSAGNSNFQFHGYGEVSAYYTNHVSNFSTIPPNYLQTIFNPQVTAFGVPLGGRFTFSTLQSGTMQNINTFSFYFDAGQFKDILRKKFTDMVEKNNKLKDLNLSSLSGSMNELQNIQNMLKNPDVIDELSKIKELDSLKAEFSKLKELDFDKVQRAVMDSVENNKQLKGVKDSLEQKGEGLDSLRQKDEDVKDSLLTVKDSLVNTGKMVEDSLTKYMAYKDSIESKLQFLSGKIESLKWIEQKIPGYEKLLQKKDKLTEMGQKFGVVDSSGNLTDVNSLKDKIDYKQLSNPGYLYDKLKSSKLMRKLDKFLYGFKTFSIGMGSPQFSELSLKNMPVNGITVEYEHKHVYAGFTYGDLQVAAPTFNLHHASYNRKVVAGSFGYGRKEANHFHITIMHSWDDTSSINPRDSIFLYQKSPKNNFVLAADFKILLFKEKLRISGELAGAQTTRDVTYTDSSIINNNVVMNNPNEWFVNIMSQRPVNTNTTVDFAFQAKIEALLFKGKTVVSATTRRVGPNYYAFGTPFLMRDVFSVEGRVSQKLWKNRIQLMAFFRRNHDNLDSSKALNSVFYNYGFDVSINIPKLPFFRAMLMPVNLQNDSAQFNLTVLNITSGYNYKVTRRIAGSTNLNYTWQHCTTRDNSLNSAGHFLTANQMFSFNNKISLNIISGYFYTENDSLVRHTFNIGTGTGFTVFKKLNASVGGNLYISTTELKWGAYMQVNMNFLKYFSFNIRLEHNQFNNYLFQPYNPDYFQFIGRGVLTARW